MGKRKPKTGITGLSRFLTALNEEQTGTQPERTSAVKLGVQEDLEHNGTSSGQLHGDENESSRGKTIRVESMSNPTPILVEPLKKGGSKFNATGLVPVYGDESQVPEHLKKYYSQRTRYFSLYDTPPGCLLDEEGWYSITPERIADQIAERCRCDVVLDAFCGVGGNTIAFAKTCERVIALDINPTRLALARHNAQIYGVADRIEFIQADYISFARAYLSSSSATSPNKHKQIDVVFLSPPWGGPSYLSGSNIVTDNNTDELETTNLESHPTYSLSSIQPIHGKDLFTLSRKITSNIAYYLPRNTNLSEISSLLNTSSSFDDQNRLQGEQVEVEEEWMGNKLKALTCYFGGLVTGQDHLF